MVTKGLPNQQSTVEGIGDGSHSQIYIPDYTVEAVTDLIIVRISTDQYAGALHAASLDRHLRAVGQESDAGEFPASSDAPSPLVEYTSRDHLLDSDADAAAVNNLVNMETKSCDVWKSFVLCVTFARLSFVKLYSPRYYENWRLVAVYALYKLWGEYACAPGLEKPRFF